MWKTPATGRKMMERTRENGTSRKMQLGGNADQLTQLNSRTLLEHQVWPDVMENW